MSGSSAANPKSDLQGLKILVIDDSKTIRRTAETLLAKEGCEVFTAVDGFDALSKIADHRPDIIFVDIMMPRLDGYQTCSLIKHNKVFKDTPVIMLSSKDGLFDRARGRLVGSEQYLTKPFTKDELLGAIHEPRGQVAVAEDRRMALIMIVDDSPTEVHVLKTALEKHGFDTVSAADGSECLSLAREVRPDLIFMDVVMPRVNGYPGHAHADARSADEIDPGRDDHDQGPGDATASGACARAPSTTSSSPSPRPCSSPRPRKCSSRGAERLNLQALAEQPFELLLELERRARAAIAARDGAPAAADEWVGIGFRLGAERFVDEPRRRPRGAAGPGAGHACAGREAVAARQPRRRGKDGRQCSRKEEGQTDPLKDPDDEKRPKRGSKRISNEGEDEKNGAAEHEVFFRSSQKGSSNNGPEYQ